MTIMRGNLFLEKWLGCSRKFTYICFHWSVQSSDANVIFSGCKRLFDWIALITCMFK